MTRKSFKRVLSMILSVLLVVTLMQPVMTFAAEEPDFVPTPEYIFRDPTADAGARIDEILSLMTPEEKITMAMAGTAGAIARLGLNAGKGGSAEAVHGAMRGGKATVFPSALGLSQSWDRDLLYQVGDIIAKEILSGGSTGALAPVLDILRDPRYGRAYETMGEDAYLIGMLGGEMAHGMNQRTEDGYMMFQPITKHFMAYGNEINRLWTNSSIPPRAMNEYFIRSFKYPVENGFLKSLMSSYPLVNGRPMSVSPLMEQLLNEWTPDYEGTGHSEYRTINDYGSGSSMWMHSQRFFPDNPDSRAFGSAMGMKIGQMSWSFRNQIESNSQTGLNSPSQMYDARARGILEMDQVEENARRNLALALRMGDYDHLGDILNPHTETLRWTNRATFMETGYGMEAALRSAQEQIVLLKNDDNTLPLKGAKSAVLLGNMAEEIQKDNYTGGSPYNIQIKHALQNVVGRDNLYFDRAVDTFAIKASNGKYLQAANNTTYREPGVSAATDIPIKATGTALVDNDVQLSEKDLLFEFYDYGDVYQELRTPINDFFVATPQLKEAQGNRAGLVNNTYGAGLGSRNILNETDWVNSMKFYVVPTNDGKYGIFTPINGNGEINSFGESAYAHEDDEDVNHGTYFKLVTEGARATEIVADPPKELVGPYRNRNHVVGADITTSPFDINGDDEVIDNLPDETYKFDFQSVRSSTDAIAETVAAAPADAPIILVVGYEAHLNAREPVDLQYTGLSKQQMRNIDYLTNTLEKDIILIVKANNPMTFGPEVQNNPRVKSILFITHSAQEEGSAIASVLFAEDYAPPAVGFAPAAEEVYMPFVTYEEYPGYLNEDGVIPAYSPAGRLTATWYEDVSDMLGASSDHEPASYRWPGYNEETNDNLSNIHGTIPTGLMTYDIIKGERTYQYFKGTPLYAFGYGLSYTTFDYSDVAVSPIVDGKFTVSGKIKNTGTVASDEVVQIYSSFTGTSRIDHHQKRLIDFDRLLNILPGEVRPFNFEIDLLDKLGVWDVEIGDYIVEPGVYQIKAAKSSDDDTAIPLTLNVTTANGGTAASVRNLNRLTLAENFDDYSNFKLDASDIELVASSIDYNANTAVQFRQNGAWINYKNVNFPAGTTNLTLRVGSDRDGAIKVYQVAPGTDPDFAELTPIATIPLSDTRAVPGLKTGLGIGPFSVTAGTPGVPDVPYNVPNPGHPAGQDGIDPFTGEAYKDAYVKPEYQTISVSASVAAGNWDVYFVTETRGSRLEWVKFSNAPDTTESLAISNIYLLNSIREKGGTLPLRAELTPVTSISPVSSWTVTALDGSPTNLATISANGVLTATGVGNGTVLVTATSNGVSASKEILITNQLDSNKIATATMTVSGTVTTIENATVDYLMLRTGTGFGATDNIMRYQGTNQQVAFFAQLMSESPDGYYLSGKRYFVIPNSDIIYSLAPTDLATISETGLVTATGVGDGQVVVTATLKNNPDITVDRVITLTNQGSPKDAFKMIQGENWEVGSGMGNATATWNRLTGNEFGMYAASGTNASRAGFLNVDFGSGADKIYMRFATVAASSDVGIWIDNYTEELGGTQVGTLALESTEDINVYKTYSASLDEVVSGVHDVYLVFPAGAVRVNWFQFTEADSDKPYIQDYTKDLTVGYAANILVKVGNPVSGLSAEVTVGGEAYSVSFGSNVSALIKVPVIINENDKLTVRLLSGDELLDSKDITMNTAPQDLWVPTVETSGNDLRVIFAAAISPGSKGYGGTINGKSATVLQDGENIIKFENVELLANNTIVVSGVKYAEYFPSYSFTFTLSYDKE